ncbi:MAG TPA: bifunctional nuclease family protein [Prosthecobacter sp.]|nr:bifunctional nuclease family protein [Prosthecobacter sp.]HRK16388.1 bifunctional nuclease family protein [Prosthecobacter sp.]
MNREVIEIQVRAVLPLEGSFAVFLGNADKTFVIYVDENVGTAISMFMRGVPKDRPLTHDLLGSVLQAFGARVERVIINHVQGDVFHARLILSAENEIHQRKVVEIDARPSDSIAMAVQQGAPLFVARKVLDSVQDVSATLAEIEKRGVEQTLPGAASEDDESGPEAEAETAGDEDDDDDGDDDDDDDDDVDDDDLEEIDPDSLDLDDLLADKDSDDDDDDDDSGGTYDDGYQNLDDDDDEGEEWKKADG